MAKEKPILCMEHCFGKKIFGFAVPPRCKYCGSDLETCELRIPPFRLPSPFREAGNSPCSVVLKPTYGNFLTDYKNSDNLHIGVTNSFGVVYEFEANGLQHNKPQEWMHCLTIKDFNKGKCFDSWSQYWDFTLGIVTGQNYWTKERYNEKTNNCYTFVLTFLRALQCPELSPFARDKKDFCEKFIVPKTASAAKYITLYRKITQFQSDP